MEIVRRKKSKPEQPDTSTPSSSHRRTTACIELSTRHLYRRAFSESSLIDACGLFDFKDGESYHFITAGDVDSLSYLKAILRQQNLDYCLLSTWCMSAEDILQLKLWCDNGQIKRLDTYVGEIFPSTYKVEFAMLKEMYADGGKNVGGEGWRSSETTLKYTLDMGKSLLLGLRHPQTSTPTHVQRMDA